MQALAECLVGERPDGRPDDELVAVDEGDRSAGQRADGLEAVERFMEDLVEIALAGRACGDIDDQLRRRRRVRDREDRGVTARLAAGRFRRNRGAGSRHRWIVPALVNGARGRSSGRSR